MLLLLARRLAVAPVPPSATIPTPVRLPSLTPPITTPATTTAPTLATPPLLTT